MKEKSDHIILSYRELLELLTIIGVVIIIVGDLKVGIMVNNVYRIEGRMRRERK
jgi:uncharacterized membrane protein YidH (DUF202 family)